MNQLQMNFEPKPTGATLRDAGMQRSVETAERVVPYSLGLPKPPNERAWGAVITAAKKLGLIVFARFEQVENPRAHRTPAAVWRRVR